MKKLFTLFALTLCLSNIKAQFVTIPDANFVNWLQANIPWAMNGNQLDTTQSSVTTANVITLNNLGITDLTGIQYFDALTELNCNYNQIQIIPRLPSSLTKLYCVYNSLSSLPMIPNTLQTLYCGFNQLTSLPSLPNSINALACDENQLASLPTLPSSLLTLHCEGNQIINISNLPNTLVQLWCSHNLLTSLPTLPNSLKNITCDNNNLTNLPVLSNLLVILNCRQNQLTGLPALPNTLNYLICDSNQINNLPSLPISLATLRCDYNNISCFQPFGNNISFLNISNNPFTCLPNYIPAMDAGTLNYPLCAPGNTNNCTDANGIVGFTYNDNNSNCHYDSGDQGLKNVPLQVYNTSGALLSQTSSASNGVYQFLQTANTYTVAIDTTGLPFTSSCIYPGLDSTMTVSTLDTNVNFALACKPGFDVGVQSIHTTGIIFPGQVHVLNVNAGDISHWYNLNCASGISGSLSFSVTGPVTFLGSSAGSLVPNVTGNVYTYNIADFGSINNNSDFQLAFQTNLTAQTGDVICVIATVTPVSGDNNPADNIYTSCYSVVNSHDPNIKETYPVNIQPGFNDWLIYTVHFQNTGNAPAFNIRLADTLDTMLDLETFQVLNYSHPNLIDLTGNVLNVRFPNIQLPDSTSNSEGSIGFIQYRAKPKTTWAAPYQIKNTTYIYFDYNSPIVTNTTLNSILTVTGLNSLKETTPNIYPNPTAGNFTIETNAKEKQTAQLFDITGHFILSQIIENGKAIIEANHLASGIYNIQIKGNDGVVNKKLVIVK